MEWKQQRHHHRNSKDHFTREIDTRVKKMTSSQNSLRFHAMACLVHHFASIIHRSMLFLLYLLCLIYFLLIFFSSIVHRFCVVLLRKFQLWVRWIVCVCAFFYFFKLFIMFHCNFNKCPLNVWFTLRSY